MNNYYIYIAIKNYTKNFVFLKEYSYKIVEIENMDDWYKNMIFNKKQREQIIEWTQEITDKDIIFIFYPYNVITIGLDEMKNRDKIVLPMKTKNIKYQIGFGIWSEYIKEKGFKEKQDDIMIDYDWGIYYNKDEKNREWTYQKNRLLYMPTKKYPQHVFFLKDYDLRELYDERMTKEDISDEMLKIELPLIYFITMPKRKEWVENCIETWKLKNAKIIPAVTEYKKDNYHLKRNELNCFKSHINVLKEAYKQNKNVLIFEDDVYIPLSRMTKYDNKKTIRLIMIEIIKKLPRDWDILYFGKCFDYCSTNYEISKNLYRIFYPLCSHAYYINKKTIHKILKADKYLLFNYPYDIFLKKIIQKNNLKTYGSIIFDQDPYIRSTIQKEKWSERKIMCIEDNKKIYLNIIIIILLCTLCICVIAKMILIGVLKKN